MRGTGTTAVGKVRSNHARNPLIPWRAVEDAAAAEADGRAGHGPGGGRIGAKAEAGNDNTERATSAEAAARARSWTGGRIAGLAWVVRFRPLPPGNMSPPSRAGGLALDLGRRLISRWLPPSAVFITGRDRL